MDYWKNYLEQKETRNVLPLDYNENIDNIIEKIEKIEIIIIEKLTYPYTRPICYSKTSKSIEIIKNYDVEYNTGYYIDIKNAYYSLPHNLFANYPKFYKYIREPLHVLSEINGKMEHIETINPQRGIPAGPISLPFFNQLIAHLPNIGLAVVDDLYMHESVVEEVKKMIINFGLEINIEKSGYIRDIYAFKDYLNKTYSLYGDDIISTKSNININEYNFFNEETKITAVHKLDNYYIRACAVPIDATFKNRQIQIDPCNCCLNDPREIYSQCSVCYYLNNKNEPCLFVGLIYRMEDIWFPNNFKLKYNNINLLHLETWHLELGLFKENLKIRFPRFIATNISTCPKCLKSAENQYCETCILFFCNYCYETSRIHFNNHKCKKIGMRCPGCAIIVEKINGCNHMTCYCKMEFTYNINKPDICEIEALIPNLSYKRLEGLSYEEYLWLWIRTVKWD